MSDGVAVIARRSGGARLEERPRVRLEAGEVRLRVLLAGICRTDLYAADGALPVEDGRVLGHELVGEVLEGGRLPRGALATVHPWTSRGTLGVELDGAFASEVIVPEASVFEVPASLPLRRAAYVEPLAAAMAVLEAPLRAEQRGVVVGAGRIASLTSRVLANAGWSALPASEAAPGELFDYAVETHADALAEAIARVRSGGLVVLKSRPAGAVPFDLAAAVRKELRFAAVAYAPFEKAIALSATLDVDDLLGEAYPLDRFAAAFEAARAPLASKIFLQPGPR